jgi:hypothetical protein
VPSDDPVTERLRILSRRRFRIAVFVVPTIYVLPLVFGLLEVLQPIAWRWGLLGLSAYGGAVLALATGAVGIGRPVVAWGEGATLDRSALAKGLALVSAAVAGLIVALISAA